MKQKGFTLAEVLTTMSIIGVVSALTLPVLMSSYQNKVYETSLRKTVNTITNAVALYMADNEISDLTQSDLYDGDKDALKAFGENYLRIVFECEKMYDSTNKCFNGTYYSLDKTATNTYMKTTTCDLGGALADGTVLCVPDAEKTYSDTAITFWADINGVNSPNMSGRDYFLIRVNKNGDVYDPTYNADNDTYSSWTKSKATPYPIGRIMANGWKLVD